MLLTKCPKCGSKIRLSSRHTVSWMLGDEGIWHPNNDQRHFKDVDFNCGCDNQELIDSVNWVAGAGVELPGHTLPDVPDLRHAKWAVAVRWPSKK